MSLRILQRQIAIITFLVIFSSLISLPTFLVPKLGLFISIAVVAAIAMPVLAILHAIDSYVDKLTEKSSLT